MALRPVHVRLLAPYRPVVAAATLKRFSTDDDVERKRDVSRMARRAQPTLEHALDHPKAVRRHLKFHFRWAKDGRSSGVDPRTLWPSKSQLEKSKTWEERLYPSLERMVRNIEAREAETTAERDQREKDVEEKMGKLQRWIGEFERKQENKLMEAETARAEREKMLEEIRAYLGFRIDPKDERFQQIVEEKERERAKAVKAARKKEKVAKELAKLEAEAKAAQAQRRAGDTDVPSG